MNKIYNLYLSLLKKYGPPHPWPWREGSQPSSPLEICVGAILTQNTNWQNVEKALTNLKNGKAMSVKKLLALSDGEMEEYLRPSGFYRQKSERVKNFCRYLLTTYQGRLEGLWEKGLEKARRELLALRGIGPETADTILLYAGKKPIFVIDEYTRRFVQKHKLSSDFSYEALQTLFMQNLPKDVKIYENYHALIVKEGKNS